MELFFAAFIAFVAPLGVRKLLNVFIDRHAYLASFVISANVICLLVGLRGSGSLAAYLLIVLTAGMGAAVAKALDESRGA